MAVLDEDFGTGLTLAEGGDAAWSSSVAATGPVRQPRDWQLLCEQAHARAERERARADAAEARAEVQPPVFASRDVPPARIRRPAHSAHTLPSHQAG